MRIISPLGFSIGSSLIWLPHHRVAPPHTCGAAVSVLAIRARRSSHLSSGIF
jgi:hypothetical protein